MNNNPSTQETKDEILYETHKDLQGQGLIMPRVKKAMDEYAKQRAIAFGQWVAHNDWVYLHSKNKWINEDQEELQQYLTDEQLYDLFTQSIEEK